jgi:hypothetical protein
MKQILILPVLFFFILIQETIAAPFSFQQDTLNNLTNVKNKAVYKTAKGKVYHISFEEDDQRLEGPAKTTAGNKRGVGKRRSAPENEACDPGNRFDGFYRKAAKMSVADNNAAGTNLAKLITRLEAFDNASIEVNDSSQRIEIEDSVVTLISVFLYAIAREADEDYHIIIGTSANPAKASFFTAECSGLPANDHPFFGKIKAVRKSLVELLGNKERCAGGYVKFNDHPRVKIIGSLFYDKEHESNLPGPASCKPKTAWELHPITEFKML